MSDTLEAQVKKLVGQNTALQKRVTTIEDIEAIRKLEMAYAFYLEHLLADDMADLWAKDGVLEWRGLGRYIGQDAVRKLWHAVKDGFAKKGNFMHPGPRYHGIITVSPDGKTAAGRWYVAGVRHGMEFLCENRYVKEDGVWKYSLLSVGAFPEISVGITGAGVAEKPKPDEAERERMSQEHMKEYPFSERLPRTPRQEHQNYLLPFSFKHPVTGKDVNKEVEAWNKAHPVPMPPGGEKWTKKK
jgi:hypothetical protein